MSSYWTGLQASVASRRNRAPGRDVGSSSWNGRGWPTKSGGNQGDPFGAARHLPANHDTSTNDYSGLTRRLEANRFGLAGAGMIGEGQEWLLNPAIQIRTKPGRQAGYMRGADFVAQVGRSEDLISWQQKMFAAGLYGEAEPIYGYFDQATAGALGYLALEVSRQGNKMAPDQILDALGAAVDSDGDGIPDSLAGSRPPDPTIQVTNPLDVQAVAQAQGQQLLGRRLPDADARSFASGYQALQSGAQGAYDADQAGGGGGTVTQAPDVSSYTEQQIRAQHGTEVDSYTYLRNINTLLAAVGLR